jgi:hypothetical protein
MYLSKAEYATCDSVVALYAYSNLGAGILRIFLKFDVITSFCNIQGIHKRVVQFQKLTRNLFLTFHGNNVHRQQRQLSKFLLRRPAVYFDLVMK